MTVEFQKGNVTRLGKEGFIVCIKGKGETLGERKEAPLCPKSPSIPFPRKEPQGTYFASKTFGTEVGILHGKPHSERCHELDSVNLDPGTGTEEYLS